MREILFFAIPAGTCTCISPPLQADERPVDAVRLALPGPSRRLQERELNGRADLHLENVTWIETEYNPRRHQHCRVKLIPVEFKMI